MPEDSMPICQQAEKKYEAGDRSWTETDEETYYYFLEVLPPIQMRGAFAPSEAWKDDSTGRPLYLWFRKFSGKFEARYATREEIANP